MENLPDEVLSNIFIRLSAKQLVQMRCVCKPWNALLSESSFVKSHLQHSIHHKDEILLFFCRAFSFYCSPFQAHPSRSPDRALTNFIKLPVNPQSGYTTYGDAIGSMNGLICFNYRSFSLPTRDIAIYIWNPSLSLVLTLPPFSSPSGDSWTKNYFRFGFDPKTDDYKVVKLTTLVPQVEEVYSMRKGSWDLISQRFPSHIDLIRRPLEVCVDGHDGHLHWLCHTVSNVEAQTILAFDLGEETFRKIPLPDTIRHPHGNLVFGVLAGKLCVMSRVGDGDQCEVWVMDEYGITESWVKHHAFSQFSGGIFPYGFTLHNEFLFALERDHFALYDPVAEKSKTFEITPSLDKVDKIVEYVDSLVWIVPDEHEMSCYSISQVPF